MSIIGKIIGGAGGFALGGPIGALLGVIGGHMVDRLRKQVKFDDSFNVNNANDYSAKSVAFTLAVIALSAKMAKSDGTVTQDEIAAIKKIFNILPSENAEVAKVFNFAKQDAKGFEPYAIQIYGMFKNNPQVLEELIWCLSYVAKSDGEIHPLEMEFLKNVAEIFKFDELKLEQILGVSKQGNTTDAYTKLGLNKNATDDEIKKTYRKLVKEYHPDSLIAKGMPKDTINVATEKLKMINKAYEDICKERNIS